MDRFKVGDIIQDKFKVTDDLGEGGMAYVLAADQKDLDRRVALKFLLPKIVGKPQLVERFAREAIAGSKIKNEHVAAVYDVGKIDGVPFIVMEHLEGKDLGAFLKEKAPLSIPTTVDLVLQAAEGIHAAHVIGIIHRDLNPENLFVIRAPDGTWCVKVLDFGISKSSFHDGAALTSTSHVMGTPAYMSPEQLKASRDVDVRTDIWALAVILYEAICGARPFAGSSFLDVYASIIGTMYKPLSHHREEVSPELEDIFDETFALDPADRIPSIPVLAARLARFGTEAGRASSERIRRLASGSSAPSHDAQILAATAPGIRDVVLVDATREATKTTVDPPRSRRRVPLAALGALAAVAGAFAVGRVTGTSAPAAPSAVASVTPAPSVSAVLPSASLAAPAVVPEAIAAPPASASSATPEPATVAIVTNGSGSCAGGATPACEAACSSHRPGSCFELAKALEKTGTAKDLGRAARLYQAECDHATFPACGRLATLYANGKGVTRDTLRAVTLYDLACSGGDGTACVSVGAMKFGGDGVPKDQALGARYFRSGCSKGEAEGCMRFSIAKLTGAGVTKDVSAGLDELDGMCTRGNGAACAELGTAYDRGLGVDLAADSDRARRYAEKSRTAAKR